MHKHHKVVHTFLTISSVFMLLYWSNCCCVMGGRMAFRGFGGTGELAEMAGPVMRELVMEAMRWRGEAETLRSSPLLLTAMEVMGVTRLARGVAELRLLRGVAELRPEGGRGETVREGKVGVTVAKVSVC